MARLQAGNSRRHFPISCRKRDLFFCKASSLSVDPRHIPIQWFVKASSHWDKPMGREPDHPVLSCCEFQKEWSHTSTHPYAFIMCICAVLLLVDGAERSVSRFTSREKTTITHWKGRRLGPVVNMDGGEEIIFVLSRNRTFV